jgi:serine/threonine protein kinase
MCEVFLKHIDSGAFSNIYKTTTDNSNTKITLNQKLNLDKDKPICIKLSSIDTGVKEYEYIKQFDNKYVIKSLFGYYDPLINLHIIAMPLYLGNITEYKNIINFNSFVNQMIEGIKYIHSLNIIHCDIKPQNILIKKTNEITFCIIDFNTAYVYKQGNMHKKFKADYTCQQIIGTLTFSSIFVLLYCLPFRRDDLESFFITCLYLNSDIDENLFTNENNINILRKFRICMYEYTTIQAIRSYKFYEDIDYNSIKSLILNDLGKYNKK